MSYSGTVELTELTSSCSRPFKNLDELRKKRGNIGRRETLSSQREQLEAGDA